jgi:thioredoxin-like negative regulator of GroEL
MALPVVPQENFEASLAASGPTVVAFIADWCGYCERFLPEFEKAAARHPERRFALADVSDDEADPRWDEYGIHVVPSVMFFVEGKPAARLDGVLGRGVEPRVLEAWLGKLP